MPLLELFETLIFGGLHLLNSRGVVLPSLWRPRKTGHDNKKRALRLKADNCSLRVIQTVARGIICAAAQYI